jgi:hypothetical protein
MADAGNSALVVPVARPPAPVGPNVPTQTPTASTMADAGNSVVVVPVAPPPAPVDPNIPTRIPTASKKSPIYHHKAPAVLKPRKVFLGPITKKLLSTHPTEQAVVEKHNRAQDVVNKMLLTATGWTKETVPARIPFPPQVLTIDMEQVEELALEILADRDQAVVDAVRVSYSELKSRHDDILLGMQEAMKQHRMSAKERDALVKNHQREVKQMQKQHALKLGAVSELLNLAEEKAAKLKAELEAERAIQKRTFKSFLRASAHSLKYLSKK